MVLNIKKEFLHTLFLWFIDYVMEIDIFFVDFVDSRGLVEPAGSCFSFCSWPGDSYIHLELFELCHCFIEYFL